MAAVNVTASGAQTVAGRCDRIMVQVNAALTGTIQVLDGTRLLGTITNPSVSNKFDFNKFSTSVVINPSATTDLTINIQSGHGPL